eukprot:TRINITY_DN12236_c0_g1_i1.p1 TRINITY_DN12236_c0_g1~~TRINITY_DN12236_c0_g1_i1.p1  ORF type:complete len:713 (+),score=162.23 TRINITY_DN12236_c0_g1_i1:113-2251(+)
MGLRWVLLMSGCAAVEAQCRAALDAMLQHYDPVFPPPSADPVVVKVSATITKVNGLDTRKQKFALSMYFRQQWVDERLAWREHAATCKQRYLTDLKSGRIWTPDTFFPTSEGLPEVEVDHTEEYVHIHEDGTVVWSRRVALDVTCAMDFTYYPFDKQTCITRIESYAYTVDTLRIVGASEAADDEGGLQGLGDQTLEYLDGDKDVVFVLNYELSPPVTVASNQTIAGKVYPAAVITWSFARVHAGFVITSLSQLWLISAMSIMGCFVDINSAPARVSIAMLSVLAAINTLTDLRQDVPRVPYLTAMDVLYLVTMWGVMFNVVEYCVMNHLLSLINAREQHIAKLKNWRLKHQDLPPPIRPWTKSDRMKARAEVRELFAFFDTNSSGTISYNDFRLLILTAAEERGRVLTVEALATHVVASRAPFVLQDVNEVVLDSPLAPYIGVCTEPRSAVFITGEGRDCTCFRIACTKSDICRFERLYRLWAPLFYVYIQVVWAVWVLTFGNMTVTVGVGLPLFGLLFGAFCVNFYCCGKATAVERSPQDQAIGSPLLFPGEPALVDAMVESYREMKDLGDALDPGAAMPEDSPQPRLSVEDLGNQRHPSMKQDHPCFLRASLSHTNKDDSAHPKPEPSSSLKADASSPKAKGDSPAIGVSKLLGSFRNDGTLRRGPSKGQIPMSPPSRQSSAKWGGSAAPFSLHASSCVEEVAKDVVDF